MIRGLVLPICLTIFGCNVEGKTSASKSVSMGAGKEAENALNYGVGMRKQ